MSIDYQAIGKRIHDFREDQDLKQKDLAKISNISQKTLNRIENGKQEIKLDELLQISKVLCISPNRLLDLEFITDDISYITNRFIKKLGPHTTKDKSIASTDGVFVPQDLLFSTSEDYLVLSAKEYLFSLIQKIAEANDSKSRMSEESYAKHIANAWNEYCKEKKREEAEKKREEAKKKDEETEMKDEETEMKDEETEKKDEETEMKDEEPEKKKSNRKKRGERAKTLKYFLISPEQLEDLIEKEVNVRLKTEQALEAVNGIPEELNIRFKAKQELEIVNEISDK